MPQMNPGGKFVFGVSRMREDLKLRFPPQAAEEYEISREGRVYLFTGAKATDRFCVTRKGLLLPSKLGPILRDTPGLLDCRAPEGAFIAFAMAAGGPLMEWVRDDRGTLERF